MREPCRRPSLELGRLIFMIITIWVVSMENSLETTRQPVKPRAQKIAIRMTPPRPAPMTRPKEPVKQKIFVGWQRPCESWITNVGGKEAAAASGRAAY